METDSSEFFFKNSELSIELSKLILDSPEIEDSLSKDSTVVFLPDFDPELKEFNLQTAKKIEAEGEKVVYVRVKQMAPRVTSRLRGVEVSRTFEGLGTSY